MNADTMDRSEVASSAASGSVGLTRTHTHDDNTLSGEEGTLDSVEDAILRTLKRYSSQQHHHDHGSQENARRPRGRRHNNVDDDEDDDQCSSPSVNAPLPRSSNPDDMEVLSHLLQQVQDLRRGQRQGSQRPKESPLSKSAQPSRSFDRRRSRRGEEKRGGTSSDELRMALEAAALAAVAAADAAEAAALSVARNTEAINFMVKSMQSSKKQRKAMNAAASEERKEIAKSNHVTHWILGFMAVTTIAWRFGVVRVVKGFSSKFSDPVAFVGSLVGGNDDPPAEKPVEKGNLLDRISHVELPSILQNDSSSSSEQKDSVTACKETQIGRAHV